MEGNQERFVSDAKCHPQTLVAHPQCVGVSMDARHAPKAPEQVLLSELLAQILSACLNLQRGGTRCSSRLAVEVLGHLSREHCLEEVGEVLVVQVDAEDGEELGCGQDDTPDRKINRCIRGDLLATRTGL